MKISDDVIDRAGMGSRVRTHGGRTGRVYVDKGWSIEHKSVNSVHFPGTYQVSPGESCLLSLRIPRPLHIFNPLRPQLFRHNWADFKEHKAAYFGFSVKV